MKITRIALLSVLALVACNREKVQPEGGDESAAGALTPQQKQVKAVADYKQKQAAFADSVLKNSVTTRAIVGKLGEGYQVGTVAMRDSLVAFVGRTPQCYADGKNLDPYLAGTVTFYMHINAAGSDLIRVQKSQWTSQAGNITDKCFNEAARRWQLPMGMGKQASYIVQVQFK